MMSSKPARAPASIATADWLILGPTQLIFTCLNQNGHVARAVGGCVRNSLLAQLQAQDNGPSIVTTVTDIDIATTALPAQVMELAERSGIKAVPTGLQHGTVTLVTNGASFEVTTLRRDVETDGRHAKVAFTDDWALDAARRDLTINALYADADGTIFDPLDGYDDLVYQHIRFVGDPTMRIREDYLRILRFFRFFAQYGNGAIDAAGLQASISERSGLTRLSAERIRQELVKLLVAPRAVEAIVTMTSYGLLGEILPVAPNIERFRQMHQIDTGMDAPLRLAALALHTGNDASRLARRLRLSKHEHRVLEHIGVLLDQPCTSLPTVVEARRLLYSHGGANYLRLLKFRHAISNDDSKAENWLALAALVQDWPVPKFPINGNDLAVLGVEPGPQVGVILRDLEHSWANSDFTLEFDDLASIARKKLL